MAEDSESGVGDGCCLLGDSDTAILLSPIQSSPRIKVAGVQVEAGITGPLYVPAVYMCDHLSPLHRPRR